MNLSLIPHHGHIHALQSKISNSRIGVDPDTEKVLFESIETPIEIAGNKEYANSSVGIQSIQQIPEAQDRVNKELSIQDGRIGTAIYTVSNGSNFADWIEIDFSLKMFSGNIGPNVIFTQGCGMKLDINPLDAVARLASLRDTIEKLEYRGEVLVLINENFTINSVLFGHNFGPMAILSELSALPVSNIINFIFGTSNTLKLQDDIVVGNLVWQIPYPALPPRLLPPMVAPVAAEKHIWRVHENSHELALLMSKGNGAYKNCWTRIGYTLRNIKLSNPYICHRNDYGSSRRSFLFSQERFNQFLNQDPLSRSRGGQSETHASPQSGRSKSSSPPREKPRSPSAPVSSSGQSNFSEVLSKAQADASHLSVASSGKDA